MAFRKRNAPLASLPNRGPQSSSSPSSSTFRSGATSLPLADELSPNTKPIQTQPPPSLLPPGVRPSPLDGRPTTSTGTQSLDSLLAGHAGLALGNSLLIEEEGTTDYGGTLLRFYAAEGVVQGHYVHVVGMDERWGRELPGLFGGSREKGGNEEVKAKEGAKEEGKDKDRMKIAWRYERLGQFGERAERGPARSPSSTSTSSTTTEQQQPPAFCHTFDLAKRFTLPSVTSITYIPLSPPPNTSPTSTSTSTSPFSHILQTLTHALSSTPPNTIHRLLIPTLLSPALYPPSASHPQTLLPFLHSLRALLRRYPTRLTLLLTLPLSLYPRSSGLTRWIELLSDGVIELVPFPHTIDAGPPLSASASGASKENKEEKPQGMVRVHRLPVFHERGGGGGGGVGEDLAFTVSRRRFVIRPFSLPPVEGDREAQKAEGEGEGGKGGGGSMDF